MLWLLVGNADDVEPAFAEARKLLDWAVQQGSRSSAREIDGIWVNANLTLNPPAVLSTSQKPGKATRFRILETTGNSGMWLLCQIAADAAGQKIERASVIEALLAATEEASGKPQERLVPIFSTLISPSEKKVSALGPSLTLIKK